MAEILRCRLCGRLPNSHKISMDYKGVTMVCWVTECPSEEGEPEELPFLDHVVSVYGKNKKEAEKRWNEVNQ